MAISIEPPALDHYGSQLGTTDRERAAFLLARAVASSPGLSGLGPATWVVRAEPSPVLGLFGSLPAADWQWLALQAAALSAVCGTVRFIDYRSAEKLADRLASMILEVVTGGELERWRFVGIPRGGLVVLGMLAYRLGLSGRRVTPEFGWQGPLVVVDDCALSGARFGQFLRQNGSGEIIFAHLCSHPSLRRRLIQRERRVRACLAALDLEDCGPRLLGAGYEEWRQRLRRRLGEDRYWTGCPEAVGFSWSEPDRLLWDPALEELRVAWNLLPPELCLSHRESGIEVQVQPVGRGRWAPSSRVLAAELDGRTLLGDLESGAVLELSGTAAAMWGALLEAPSREDALGSLAVQFDASRDCLSRDLESLTGDLISRGLLDDRQAAER